MPAPVAVLVEVDGVPVSQAYIAYCAICRGPCGAPPPKVAYARPGKEDQGDEANQRDEALCHRKLLRPPGVTLSNLV